MLTLDLAPRIVSRDKARSSYKDKLRIRRYISTESDRAFTLQSREQIESNYHLESSVSIQPRPGSTEGEKPDSNLFAFLARTFVWLVADRAHSPFISNCFTVPRQSKGTVAGRKQLFSTLFFLFKKSINKINKIGLFTTNNGEG